jgi:adenine/guanine phosphoribosyltransferase-like PRPP-binding protein
MILPWKFISRGEKVNKFSNLCVWNGDIMEDVRFWCEPDLTKEALQLIAENNFPEFDAFATFEARGYYLAGMASAMYSRPTILIRKHKKFYDKMDHAKVSFINWKGEPETLTVLKKSLPRAKRVLVVDDILDTGRSLEAGASLLSGLGVEVVGAFYILNAASEEITSKFQFPIKSAIQHKLF